MQKYQKLKQIILAGILLFGFQIISSRAENLQYFINLDKTTIAKGYTVSAFDDQIKLSLVPGILNEDTGVEISRMQEEMDLPWKLDKLSIYQFEFRNKNAYDNHKPFYIQLGYDLESDYYKQVYFYDKNFQSWRPLPTKDYSQEKFVRSLIHLPYARIAVFSNPIVMMMGKASWYKYKGGDFAASPDFPINSKLRVYNTINNKYVDVVINDYGPDRSIHPDRVIDLDKQAFEKISSLGEGIIDVRVEQLESTPAGDAKILHIPEQGIGLFPVITASSSVVIN